MEESRPVHSTKTMLPNTAQDPFPQIPPLPLRHNNNDVKKRKLGDVDIHNAAFFKTLFLVQQLRPYFIEALKTPDFCNCTGAYEIRKRMKLVMDLYKQMQLEGNPTGNYENRSAHQPLSGEKKLEKEHLGGLCQGGPEHLQPKHVVKKSPEKQLQPGSVVPVKEPKNDWPQGSYIVGGSIFGWNFITFANRNSPVYYGVMKESYGHSHRRSEKGNLCYGTSDGSNDKKLAY